MTQKTEPFLRLRRTVKIIEYYQSPNVKKVVYSTEEATTEGTSVLETFEVRLENEETVYRKAFMKAKREAQAHRVALEDTSALVPLRWTTEQLSTPYTERSATNLSPPKAPPHSTKVRETEEICEMSFAEEFSKTRSAFFLSLLGLPVFGLAIKTLPSDQLIPILLLLAMVGGMIVAYYFQNKREHGGWKVEIDGEELRVFDKQKGGELTISVPRESILQIIPRFDGLHIFTQDEQLLVPRRDPEKLVWLKSAIEYHLGKRTKSNPTTVRRDKE